MFSGPCICIAVKKGLINELSEILLFDNVNKPQNSVITQNAFACKLFPSLYTHYTYCYTSKIKNLTEFNHLPFCIMVSFIVLRLFLNKNWNQIWGGKLFTVQTLPFQIDSMVVTV